MKLLLELDEQSNADEEIEALATVLQRGSNFIHQANGKWAYRGTKETDGFMLGDFVNIIKPVTERKPLMTLSVIHQALDDMFNDTFGFPYRSAAVFITAHYATAKLYGQPYVVIPLDQFKFVWSPLIYDAAIQFTGPKANYYLDQHDPELKELKDLDEQLKTESGQRLFKQWIRERFQQGEYTDKDLHAALVNEGEIMVNCQEYAMIQYYRLVPPAYIEAANRKFGTALEYPVDTIKLLTAITQQGTTQ